MFLNEYYWLKKILGNRKELVIRLYREPSAMSTLRNQTSSVVGYMWIESLPFMWKTVENGNKLIPEGEYDVMYTFSPRFSEQEPYRSHGNGLVPILVDVPGKSGIRIHVGNYARQSEGCILIGSAYSKGDSVDRSVDSYKAFIDLIKVYGFPKTKIIISTVKS